MSVYVPPRYAPAVKAGPLGPGAGVLMTEFPLASILGGRSPQAKMKRAWELGISVPWIRAAERAISGACSTVEWHLEDEDDVEIDDEYPDRFAQEARTLLEKPTAKLPDEAGKQLTRRELWALTFRHMGLCGNAFWFLDQPNIYGIPAAIKYLRPDRMTPDEDRAGNLVGWIIDKTPQSPGVRVPLAQILQFVLDPPDQGHFGIGLVETALLKAQNSVGLDSHLQQVLGAGGRLSGLLSPKPPDHLEPQQMQQLIADARNITEQPNAAQRMQVLAGPVDFTPTTMTIKDLQLIQTMTSARDDLLALWGVPLSQIASVATGMNSGESHKIERQAFWENANHPRLVSFVEPIQFQLLDRYVLLGTTIELEIDEPTFTDDGPRFDLLAKAVGTPLKNWERRELIGKEPFGPTVINPATGLPIDDEVWLPNTYQLVFTAPEEGTAAVGATLAVTTQDETGAPPAEAPPAASSAAGETAQVAPKAPSMKAAVRGLHGAIMAVRSSLDERFTPRVKRDVAKVLDEQRREVIARARSQAAHLMENPRDVRAIWDGPKWNRRLTEALQPHLITVAEELSHTIRSTLGRPVVGKAGPVAAVQRTLTRGGTRITGINNRTRDAVLGVVNTTNAASVAKGLSPAEAGDELEAAIEGAGMGGFDGIGLWDEYRAEMIARTEMTASYNDAALGTYGDLGVELVEAIDGDGDEECAARDGQTFTLDEADQEAADEHPNGTLDFVPILPDEEP